MVFTGPDEKVADEESRRLTVPKAYGPQFNKALLRRGIQSCDPESMGKVLAFTNSKGGVGKSTIAVHLVVRLWEAGRSVALVDADVQGSSSRWIHDAAEEVSAHRLQTPDDMLEGVPELRRQFEYIVIDGPAGLSEVTRAALFVTDVTFLPCGPSALDLWAANEALRVVRQAQAIRQGPPEVVLIPNKLQARHRLSRELTETARTLGVPAVGGLRLRQAYADAAGQGTVVARLGPEAAPAASEMDFLLKELLAHEHTTITEPICPGGGFATGSRNADPAGESDPHSAHVGPDARAGGAVR